MAFLKKVLGKIFQPLSTTKPAGRGTGLELMEMKFFNNYFSVFYPKTLPYKLSSMLFPFI